MGRGEAVRMELALGGAGLHEVDGWKVEAFGIGHGTFGGITGATEGGQEDAQGQRDRRGGWRIVP